jgi:hypothetical protein
VLFFVLVSAALGLAAIWLARIRGRGTEAAAADQTSGG